MGAGFDARVFEPWLNGDVCSGSHLCRTARCRPDTRDGDDVWVGARGVPEARWSAHSIRPGTPFFSGRDIWEMGTDRLSVVRSPSRVSSDRRSPAWRT